MAVLIYFVYQTFDCRPVLQCKRDSFISSTNICLQLCLNLSLWLKCLYILGSVGTLSDTVYEISVNAFKHLYFYTDTLMLSFDM